MKNLSDSTVLRIKVPSHLYESVKAQLTLKEGKGNFGGGAYTEAVKQTKSAGESKPKAPKAPKEEGVKTQEEGEKKSVEEMIAELEERIKSLEEKEGDKNL